MNTFIKCLSLSSLNYFSLFELIIMLNCQPFYKHKVLNNQEIKLKLENINLNKNCILSTEPVDRFI